MREVGSEEKEGEREGWKDGNREVGREVVEYSTCNLLQCKIGLTRACFGHHLPPLT